MSIININLLDLNDKVVQSFQLELYSNEIKKSLIDRIAYNLGTISDYLIFKEEEKEEENVYNVYSLINDLKIYDYDPNTLENFLKGITQKYKKVTLEYVLNFLYYFNPKFEDFDINNDYNFLITISPSIDVIIKLGISKSVFDLEDFLKTKNKIKDIRIINDFSEKVGLLDKRVKKYIVNYKRYEKIKPMEVDIKTNKNQSILKIKTNITEKDYTLNSIFANIVCYEDVPFCSFSGMYKIFQDIRDTNFVKESSTLLYESSNLITMKIKINDDYINCYINFQDKDLYFGIQLDYSIVKTDLILEGIKEKMLKVIPKIEINILKEFEVSIIQTSIISNKTFYHYVMSDLIMNDPIFSEFLAVEESSKSSKAKSGLFVNFFIKDINGKCNISIIDDTSKFPVVKSIRLRIKAIDLEIANDFIIMFRKLLTLYQEEEDKIIEFYKGYIKDFPEIKVEKEKKKKLTLSDQVPDLFLKTEGGYARKCQNPPIIIDEKESLNYEKDKVAKYPIKGEGAPHYYACNDDVYKYIGLMENKMKNKDIYKYIPCCYKESQLYKKNFRRYYYDQDVDEKGAQQNILKTNKFAQSGEFALVPKNIKDLFDFLNIYDGNNFKYIRMGVNDTPLSFLECVLEAIDYDIDNTSFRNLKKDLKLKYLESEYNKLVNYDNIAVASQENPGLSEIEIRQKFSNKESYMNPRHWIKLLETVYEYKIILFYRNKKDNDAHISLPNHELIYLQEKPIHKKLLLIYEHYGSEVVTNYPRCEIILVSDNNENIKLKQGLTYNFTNNMESPTGLTNNFDKIYNFYSKQIKQYYYNFISNKLDSVKDFNNYFIYKLNPTHQIIDIFGKCRGILCSDIILLCDPIPPLNLPTYNDNYYKEFNLKKVKDFIKKYSFNLIENKDSELKIKHPENNILFTVKISNNINSDKEKCVSYPCVNNFIKDINSMYRLSFILTEYFIYYYSLYMKEKDNSILTLETIKEFVDSKVKIDDENEYKMPNTPKLSIEILLKNNFINDDLMFLVDHEETLKRLVYILRTRIINSFESVLNYHSKPENYNFYREVNYYNSSNTNIIVQNLSYLDKIDNNIYNEIVPSKTNYFFSNNKINNGNPVYLKECEDKSDAFIESSKWIINKDFNINTFPLYNTELFLYKSRKNVKVNKNIKRKDEDISKAIKYKLKGKKHYMAIAELK